MGSMYFVAYGIDRFIMESMRFSAFAFKGTYVINGILLAIGIIGIVWAQFLAPRYRDTKFMKMV